MYFGGEAFTNRHVWVLTMFVGLLMSIGRQISDNMGIFLIILVTSLIEGFCYATVCRKIKNGGLPELSGTPARNLSDFHQGLFLDSFPIMFFPKNCEKR